MSSCISHIKIKSGWQGAKTLDIVDSTDLSSCVNSTPKLLQGNESCFKYCQYIFI